MGPAGLSISTRWHALWAQPAANEVLAIDDGTTPHPLQGHEPGQPVLVEPLTVRQWMGISGAAVSSGAGHTTASWAMLMTLANLRLGIWNSGLEDVGRARTLLRRGLFDKLMAYFFRLFQAQTLLLQELRGRFGGPWRRYWQLSDGGHFDNSALYELLRRRVPLIVFCGAGQDRDHQATDVAEITRIARIDFGCQIKEVDLDGEFQAPTLAKTSPRSRLAAHCWVLLPTRRRCSGNLHGLAHSMPGT